MHLVWILCVFFGGGTFFVEAYKCDTFVDITDGTREGNTIIKNGVIYNPENYFAEGETIQGCICNVKKCVRRCCAMGQTMDLTTRKCVQSTQSNFFPEFNVFNIINVPENEICDTTEVKIKIDEDFTVGENGVLIWDTLEFAVNDFRLAVTPDNQTYAIACVINEETEVDKVISCLGNVLF